MTPRSSKRSLHIIGKWANVLGIFTPLPSNDDWKSSDLRTQQYNDCNRFEEILAALKDAGLDFDREHLMDLAGSLGVHMIACPHTNCDFFQAMAVPSPDKCKRSNVTGLTTRFHHSGFIQL